MMWVIFDAKARKKVTSNGGYKVVHLGCQTKTRRVKPQQSEFD